MLIGLVLWKIGDQHQGIVLNVGGGGGGRGKSSYREK